MIKSKFGIQETKIIIRKMIKKGLNIKKDGTTMIYVEIVRYMNDGKRITRQIPTNVMVKPKDWNGKKDDGIVRTTDPEWTTKNNTINSIFANYCVMLADREKGTWVEDFNPKNLIPIDDMFPKMEKSLTDYLQDYIDLRTKNKEPYNTTKVYGSLKTLIEKYEQEKNVKLKFDDMNLVWSDSFYSWMVGKDYENGTIHKVYVRLITFLSFYYERKDEIKIKLTDKFKLKRFKHGKKSENEPHPLNPEQFRILSNHQFKDIFLRKTKDRFLLQCATGLRYSDVIRIGKDMIKNNNIEIEPQKTRNKSDNKCIIPLNQTSESILKKYDYNTTLLKISNQKYNDSLTRMWKELNKEHENKFDDFTSHDGRDTFISMMIISGCDIPTLMKMTGHRNYEELRKYIKILDQHPTEMMKKVDIFN